jgi:predicted dehydrogenase
MSGTYLFLLCEADKLMIDSGNWRDSNTTAPCLLTKSCHDIDFLLWLLSAPASGDSFENEPFHLPSTVRSTGSQRLYRKARKPRAAGAATNCLSCPIEPDCKHSSKNIYLKMHFDEGDLTWPVHVVVPDIEDVYAAKGKEAAKAKLLEALAEDYPPDTPAEKIASRQWYGRCVWESDNNVVDDQTVVMEWDDDFNASHTGKTGEVGDLGWRGAKTAMFHMVAFTEAVCARRGRIYGSEGEVSYDSENIYVIDFKTEKTTHHFVPAPPDSGHGGGDDALADNMIRAVIAAESGEMSAEQAQRAHLGVDLEEMVRSHVMVFAAEKARTTGEAVNWQEYWDKTVEEVLGGLGVNGLLKE